MLSTRHTARRVAYHSRIRNPGRLLSNLPQDTNDVVIVGGGPAGLALAAALGSKKNLKITLIEANNLDSTRQWSPTPSAYSNRVSSITNVSKEFLRDIGVWRHVDQSRTAPIEQMQVWDGVSDARITFLTSDIGPDTLEMARLTENLNLQRAALRRIDELSASVSVIDNVKVSTIESDKTPLSWPIVNLSNGQVLRTRLLVGADGFNSPVRHFANIASYGWSYPTHGVVATLNHAPSPYSPNRTAYQRFLPTGPIAFLPLSSTTSSLVWSTSPSLAAILKSIPPAALAHLVNAAFRLPELSMRYLNAILLDSPSPITPDTILDQIQFRELSHTIDPSSPLFSSNPSLIMNGIPPLGSEAFPPLVTSIQPSSPASFPLKLSHAESYVGDGRVALVGDAAHTVHPLAGQGLNMGIGDVQALADTIQSTIEVGGDIGLYTSLLPYHQARYAENHLLLSMTDKLHKIYSIPSPTSHLSAPIIWGRSVGLEVLNELGSIKGAVMGAAGASSQHNHLSKADQATRRLGEVTASVVETVGSTYQVGKAVFGTVGNFAGSLIAGAVRSVVDRR